MLNARIVGKVLQEYRERKNYSQEVLSGFAQIGRTHLSMIERGERKPTLETLFRIADALGVPPHKIVETIEKRMEQ